MSIEVICPLCDRAFRVRDEARGRKIPCPDCESLVRVGSDGPSRRPPDARRSTRQGKRKRRQKSSAGLILAISGGFFFVALLGGGVAWLLNRENSEAAAASAQTEEGNPDEGANAEPSANGLEGLVGVTAAQQTADQKTAPPVEKRLGPVVLPDAERLAQLTETGSVKGFQLKLPPGLKLVEDEARTVNGGMEHGMKWNGTIAGQEDCEIGIGVAVKELESHENLRAFTYILDLRASREGLNISKEVITLGNTTALRFAFEKNRKTQMGCVLFYDWGTVTLAGKTPAPIGSEPFLLINTVFLSLERSS